MPCRGDTHWHPAPTFKKPLGSGRQASSDRVSAQSQPTVGMEIAKICSFCSSVRQRVAHVTFSRSLAGSNNCQRLWKSHEIGHSGWQNTRPLARSSTTILPAVYCTYLQTHMCAPESTQDEVWLSSQPLSTMAPPFRADVAGHGTAICAKVRNRSSSYVMYVLGRAVMTKPSWLRGCSPPSSVHVSNLGAAKAYSSV